MMDILLVILELVAVTMAVMACALAVILIFIMLKQMIGRLISPLRLAALIHSAPKLVKKDKPKKKKKTRRTEYMSKEASEGITFNDIFMFMIAVPLVLLWVGFAGFVIHSGLQDD